MRKLSALLHKVMEDERREREAAEEAILAHNQRETRRLMKRLGLTLGRNKK